MPLFNLTDLHAQLPRNQRLIGLDPGTRTIGIALSDVRRVLASPYGSIKRGKLAESVEAIMAIARREDVGGFVVGLPLLMDGTLGPSAQAARDWTFALTDATGLPAAMWDERLSSAEANRSLSSQGANRARRAATVDRMAAAVILQAALDYLRPLPGDSED
ncbi:Holliday junction resolvase RuvX [Acidisphaera sp. L21]|jgi:putative Holliday junction resolvase|uniref:Holliday junction resolvase RuvX n=1 Tax=Acidisphaera sp. L21 TaxID=1641851 RepID=UPI00131BDA6A|nr:Holliday junction resolvase RuvX [Acidisphaera sp. L21]